MAVASDFLKTYFEADNFQKQSPRGVLQKECFQENTCARVSNLIKLQASDQKARQNKNLNILRSKRALKMKQKAFFIIYKDFH